MMRKIHHDFLLRDFHIPANTIFMFLLEIASRDAANFPDPDLWVGGTFTRRNKATFDSSKLYLKLELRF